MFAFFRTRVRLGPGRRAWKESDLLIHCKSNPAKLAIAARLRQETTLSVKTIVGRMHLGTSKSNNARLYGCPFSRGGDSVLPSKARS